MSIFDRLKKVVENAPTETSAATVQQKIFTFAALPEILLTMATLFKGGNNYRIIRQAF